MATPYSFGPPIETKSIHSSSKDLTRIKKIMNEEFPQRPALNVTKSLTPQKKNRNKGVLFFQIIPDDFSESIAPPPISKKQAIKEADLPERPAENFKVTIKNHYGLPINSLKKTEDEHNSLQLPTDDSTKDTAGLIKPFTAKKKNKKWQPLPLDIPTTLNTHIVGRQFYRRNQDPTLNSAQAPPQNAHLTFKRNLPNDNSSPHKPTNITSKMSTNNQPTTHYPTTPTSPSRKATRMSPINNPSEEMHQTNKKPHSAVRVNNRRYQRRGSIYQNALRDRPYYAMIQCGLSRPGSTSSTTSSCSSDGIQSCNQPKNCSFGHEGDRYHDSPWHIQRFVLGFNVDLWESKVGPEGKLDLFNRRNELMAIGDIINREGMKVGHRKLVEMERAKRGLPPQTDEWCWAGRAYKAKTGSFSKYGNGNWEDQTDTSTCEEDNWEDHTLAGTSVSYQRDGDTGDDEEFIDENKMRFEEHLRAETALYEVEQAQAKNAREEEELTLQQNNAILDRELWEQQQEYERDMHARNTREEYDELFWYVNLQVEQQQLRDQEEHRRCYQEQQRQYEAQRHATRAYNIPRPSPYSITTSTVAPMETVRYNKPIARPTTTRTSTISQAVQSSFFVASAVSEIPHKLSPQWIQTPRSHMHGITGDRWCLFEHFGPVTLSED
ncbi:uncharacterized protein LAJ45_07185 [Morchella importuna]|uniref:uncharacterized protein n=1 Tax=Morchella importuna TaxID=1174673 RepID=UPI001E8E5C15|nr:uncharacterized protein LAJ45_07185 [Morchella importuna]KAH8148842.1 hypothetical protein LAJ45_07185 [Morchella importuna]